MCGLLGLFRVSSNAAPVDPELLLRMRDTMTHRGPDDAGFYIAPHQEVALAHRRLSIIDLSRAAAQPMKNEDESLVLVFNGEIYNHAELREELEACGARFRTDHSDTEVILKGYQEWGVEILPRLRGMFAFAIWDRKRRLVWLARDRVGVKPLYYTFAAGHFMFASEIKAILAHPNVKRTVDETALADFLSFLVSPAPRTLFSGILKLPAGHTMTVHDDGRVETKRYWNPFFEVGSIGRKSDEEWGDLLMDSLRESIRYRMVSDVNFGVFLSGGLDSSLNTALMAEQMNRPVDTFSIGFKGHEAYNELAYARMIRDRYKTRHHEIMIDEKDFVDFLPKLVHHQDEPIVDPVCVPVYYVAKLAKDNGTTVCQVGEGSDELFCGYPSWGRVLGMAPWARGYQALPAFLRRGLYGAVDGLVSSPARGMRRLELLRRASFDEKLFWGGAEGFPETAKSRFLSAGLRNRLRGHSSGDAIAALHRDFLADAPPGADDLHWMTYLDLRLRLPELLLMRVDKMTMATAVEARVPFLDQKFVKLAMQIPQSVKFRNRTTKAILKKAVRPILPREIVDRKKQGFAVPVEEWFQAKLGAWAGQTILEFAKETDYFDPKAVAPMVERPDFKNWFLLNFVLWHQSWIEGRDIRLPL